ncbi:MAG: 3-deoxy-7-phosphoheptulonate synthase [Armatimonadetes bacterium]|jgi:3-deoxy-7-phosphoheptulonate synthase|nr:3-deoxy-7-phosphoheptulonate synthase [Armatimonadota bacterium]
MVIIMETGAAPEDISAVTDAITLEGLTPFENPGVERKVIAVLGVIDAQKIRLMDKFQNMPGVERVTLISDPYKLPSRQCHPKDSTFEVCGVPIGGPLLTIIAGPCSIESKEQALETAHAVKAAGATLLRGGAFKPRSSPYAFQGLGEEGLRILAECREATGLPIVTEVVDPHDVGIVCQYADVLQIGARNMQNYRLLQRVGQSRTPVLLKRGMGVRIREMLMAAEYIMVEGNHQVILCERGIITFEDSTRFTTDINAIPVLKHLSHLPVVLDPSHATGSARYVGPVAKAGIAAGADGLIMEVHPQPGEALSDGPQSLKPEAFAQLMGELRRVAAAVDRVCPPDQPAR